MLPESGFEELRSYRPISSRRPRTKLADAHEYHKVGHFTCVSKDDCISHANLIQIIEEVKEQLLKTTKRNFPRTSNWNTRS